MATSPSAYFPHLILPKGQQIKDGLYCILRDAILEGRLSAGTKLPSSRALAEMMSISRNSVLAALERLLDEGYLVTKPSSGTYVADIIPDQLIQIQNDRQQAVYQPTPRAPLPLCAHLQRVRHAGAGHPRPGQRSAFDHLAAFALPAVCEIRL